MGKATKQITKKTVNNNNGLSKSFSLKSRKVQFFVTILVIAIVGGGYMTIKSFAASSAANLSNGYLTASGNYSVVTDASKNNARVIRLNAARSTAYTKSYPGTHTTYLRIPANVKVRYCYTAKADAPTGANLLGFSSYATGTGDLGIPTSPNTIIGTSYSSYCTPYEFNQGRTYAHIFLYTTTNTPVNVSQLYAEY